MIGIQKKRKRKKKEIYNYELWFEVNYEHQKKKKKPTWKLSIKSLIVFTLYLSTNISKQMNLEISYTTQVYRRVAKISLFFSSKFGIRLFSIILNFFFSIWNSMVVFDNFPNFYSIWNSFNVLRNSHSSRRYS